MTQGRGIREGQSGSKNPAPLAIYMCLCVCIFGALADEISCLELQVPRRRVEEWLPRNCSRFNLSWLLHSHPCDSGPSSNTGSVTTPSAADTVHPLNPPAASMDSLHTVKSPHRKSGTCALLLGALWQGELKRGARRKHPGEVHNQ